MPGDLEELPLFPLNTVLFPYSELMVHVFEDRYRELVRHCLQYDTGFGVCLIRSGQEAGSDLPDPYMIGTVARIISAQTYDDGRIDLKIRGERRFRVRVLDDSKQFLTGFVEPVVEAEVEESPRSDALVLKVREYLEEYIETAFERIDIKIAKVRLPETPTALSFYASTFLNIENIRKQHLLETTDTIDRITEILPVLEEHMLHAQEMQIIEADLPDVSRLSSQDFDDVIINN